MTEHDDYYEDDYYDDEDAEYYDDDELAQLSALAEALDDHQEQQFWAEAEERFEKRLGRKLLPDGFVVDGIIKDRRRARNLLSKRPRPRPPKRRYPGHISAPAPSAFYTEPSTRDIERQVGKLAATLGNALIATRKALDTELDRSVATLREEIGTGDRLRDNLLDALTGSLKERTAGVVFLSLGIALATAGAVVSNL